MLMHSILLATDQTVQEHDKRNKTFKLLKLKTSHTDITADAGGVMLNCMRDEALAIFLTFASVLGVKLLAGYLGKLKL